MTLSDYLAALRRGWIVILVSFLLVVGAAAALTLRGTDVYSATTQLYVGSASETDEAGSATERADIAGARAASFATVLGGSVALEQVQEEVGGSGDESVSVTSVPETVIIEVAVTSSDPQRAADVAQGYADIAPEVLEGLETGSSGRSAVRVTTVSEPTVPSAPAPQSRTRSLVAAGLLGLGIGVAIVLVRETVRRERAELEARQRSAETAAGS